MTDADVYDFATEKARRRTTVTIREPRGCGDEGCIAGWVRDDTGLIKCENCWNGEGA